MARLKKEILEKEFSYNAFYQMIDSSVLSMFVYDRLPDTIPQDILENVFNKKGQLIGFQYDGDLIIAPFEYGADPDVYGYGKKIIATSRNGKVWTFDRIKDADKIAIGWNNSKHCPDYMNLIAAESLNNIHLSLKLNILYSRLKPILTASDDKSKTAIESIIRDIINGKLDSTIISDNFLSLIDERGKSIDVLNVTDVAASDKIQYLIKAFEDVQRLLYTFNGQAIQGNGKLAQQSVDEVNGATSTSFIYPNNKLAHRQMWCDEMNAKFGTNISVRFSDSWIVEMEKYDENETPDASSEEIQESEENDDEEKTN